MDINVTSTVGNNTPSMDDISKSVLSAQFGTSLSLVIVGLPCSFCNFILFIVILKTKKLRTNFYLCLMHVAIADTLFCFCYSVSGLKRVVLHLYDMPETTYKFACLWHVFPASTFADTSAAQTFTIAFDRLLCLAVPLRYRTFDTRYLQLVNLAMWIIPIGALIISGFVYITSNILVPNCTIGIIWDTEFTSVWNGVALGFNISTITVYIMLVPMLFGRLRSGKRQGKNMIIVKESLQFRAMVTSFMLLGVYSCIVLTSQLFLQVTNPLAPIVKASIQPIAAIMLLVASGLSFTICVLRIKDVREAIRKVFKLNQHTSVVMNITHH